MASQSHDRSLVRSPTKYRRYAPPFGSIITELKSVETHLRVLLNRQRKHLEDIKKATNYDSTRKLIERYDDYNAAGSSTQSSPSQLSGPSTPVRRGTAPSTPQSASPALGGVLPNTPRAPGHLAGISGTPVRASDCHHSNPPPSSSTRLAFLNIQLTTSLHGHDPGSGPPPLPTHWPAHTPHSPEKMVRPRCRLHPRGRPLARVSNAVRTGLRRVFQA